MASDNIELKGAAFQILTASRPIIDGVVDSSKANAFLLEYLLTCMSEEGGSGRTFEVLPYVAANDLSRLYRHLRADSDPRSFGLLGRVREGLRNQYLHGGSEQRARVVNGVLEHIFEDSTCRSDFEEWALDPELRDALRAAEEWADSQRAPPTGRPS
jgi:hypothetical protein